MYKLIYRNLITLYHLGLIFLYPIRSQGYYWVKSPRSYTFESDYFLFLLLGSAQFSDLGSPIKVCTLWSFFRQDGP